MPVGRRFSDALYLAPGVSSGSAGRATRRSRAASGLDNQYVVDGVNITNPGYGALGSYSIVFGSLGNATPYDFIKEVQVKTGGYEAEYGQSTGGVVNVVTKSGSNNFRGSVFGYSRPGALRPSGRSSRARTAPCNSASNEPSDAGFEVGGPIIRDRLFFFGAINPSWETRDVQRRRRASRCESLGVRGPQAPDLNRTPAKATWQIASSHRLDASFFGDPSKGEMGPQRLSALLAPTPRVQQLEKFGGNNQTVRYDGVLVADVPRRGLVRATRATRS